MFTDLRKTAKDHIIVVAHRGVAGGNIPCNTRASYEIALKQGADMLETDISRTGDGTLVIFHPGMERIHLRTDKKIPESTDEEVAQMRFCNYDSSPTQFGLMRFDELLDTYRDRCYLNIDKFWDHPEEIYHEIKKKGMINQCLVKSTLKDDVLDVLERVAPDVPFLPIVSETHPRHEELMERNINYIGAEVLFKRDDSPVATDEFITKMHNDGKLVWVNSIIYNVKAQLAAGHSDDTALTESEDLGWGWLADKGFDFIQTDWPQMLIGYLKSSGKYYR